MLNRGYIYICILITETANVAEIVGRDRQDQNGSGKSYFSHVGFFLFIAWDKVWVQAKIAAANNPRACQVILS